MRSNCYKKDKLYNYKYEILIPRDIVAHHIIHKNSTYRSFSKLVVKSYLKAKKCFNAIDK